MSEWVSLEEGLKAFGLRIAPVRGGVPSGWSEMRKGFFRVKAEMWRFQVVAKVIAENVPSIVEYPPMQAGTGFSTGDLKEKVEAAIAASKSSGD